MQKDLTVLKITANKSSMAFKVPEQYLLTVEKVKRNHFRFDLTEIEQQRNMFFIPREGKPLGDFYLVRANRVVGGWYLVTVNIPSEGRWPSYQEMKYIEGLFFDKGDQVFYYNPVNTTKYWFCMWMKDDKDFRLPGSAYSRPFRNVPGFFIHYYHQVVKWFKLRFKRRYWK